jgi:anti-anti-sigma factor
MSTPTEHAPPKVERSGDLTIITFTANPLRAVEDVITRELDGLAVGAGERHLMLDFTNVKYLNSVELSTLITLHRRVRSAGGRLTLFNLNAQLRRVLAVTRLDTLLVICREDDAGACGPTGSTRDEAAVSHMT